jgi:toxin YoeB
MGKYQVELSKSANKDLESIKKSGKKIDIEKITTFFKEIETDPRSGTGNTEQLKYNDGEVWSKRINRKDRFVYRIYEEDMTIVIINVLGHYDDK